MAQLYGNRWKHLGTTLGHGGQADVYLVRDITNDNTSQYALKVLRRKEEDEKSNPQLPRFRNEIRALVHLQHENVIRYLDYNVDVAPFYLVTEYYSGGSLAKLDRQVFAEIETVLSLFMQICDGVAAAHAAGIVHRDIKPENILLQGPRGPAVVADFGLCYFEHGEHHTLTGEVVGPAKGFMSPEAERGQVELVGKHSDVYSLGKILYWLLNKGRRTVAREDYRVKEFDLVAITDNQLMEHVNQMLDRMLKENVGDRYEDAAEVADKARTLERLMREHYNPISPNVPQRCVYCGQGTYQVKFEADTADFNDRRILRFGLRGGGTLPLLIMTCDWCGHLQSFHVEDMSVRERWLGKRP